MGGHSQLTPWAMPKAFIESKTVLSQNKKVNMDLSNVWCVEPVRGFP